MLGFFLRLMKKLLNKKEHRRLKKKNVDFTDMVSVVGAYASPEDLILEFGTKPDNSNIDRLRKLGYNVYPLDLDRTKLLGSSANFDFQQILSSKGKIFDYQFDIIFSDGTFSMAASRALRRYLFTLVSELLDVNGIFLMYLSKPYGSKLRVSAVDRQLIRTFKEVEVINEFFNEPVYCCRFPRIL